MKIYKDRNLLMKELGNGLNIMEIGVFKGDFSKFIQDEMKPLSLHLVDIFEGDMCSGDKDGNNIVWTNLSNEFNSLKNYFKESNNVFIHKGFSYDILSKFDDGYFDLIYIDGDHSYEGVKKDLNVSYEKTKKGGFIMGHDYTNERFPGVVKAVNEFCDEKELNIDSLTEDGCPTFLIIKK